MVSPTVCSAKPVPMDSDKKSIKTLIKSFFHKKKEKAKNIRTEKQQITQDEPVQDKEIKSEIDHVARITSQIENIDLKDKKQTVFKPLLIKNEEDDELDNFHFKIIAEPRNNRIHSHSSGDSGFSDNLESPDKSEIEIKSNISDKFDNIDKLPSNSSDDSGFLEKSRKKTLDIFNNDPITNESTKSNDDCDSKLDKNVNTSEKDENCEDLTQAIDRLAIENDKPKGKRVQVVVVKRAPIKNKVSDFTPYSDPYPIREDQLRQISQINQRTLTGGQVIVNKCQPTDSLAEINIACENLQQKSQYLQNERDRYLEDVLEFIHEDTSKTNQDGVSAVNKSSVFPPNKMAALFDTQQKVPDYFLADLESKTIGQDEILQLLNENNFEMPQADPIPEIVNDSNFEKDVFQLIQEELNKTSNEAYLNPYPTPPRSENQVPSPMLASPSSFYPSNSEYTLSPERSPIYNSDYEKYQYIPTYEEEKDSTDEKARQRTVSSSSMTMKQFKDMQKEIDQNFSKNECCQLSRKNCIEIFQERVLKLKKEERQHLCVNVATIDINSIYGVLHHVMLSLSAGCDNEDLQLVLFSLLCQRAMAQNISIFTDEYGLNLLKAACLRCPDKPLLTRYLVECIRKAIKMNPEEAAGKDYIFHEVDALGDTLVIACARAGDTCAEVLYELVRTYPNELPLFKLHHSNADGYTALHVACNQHSATSPKLGAVHVLLVHGGFELTEGDVKGGDTALHLAVNSVNCDLQLILLMFKQVDRKEWKSLAHYPNLSSRTPLDLARLATKSASRPNYPSEVLDFLKKCR